MILGYAAGDADFYLEILRDYAAAYGDTENALVKSFEEKDWKNYEIKVHALKGTSKTIGAAGVSDKAKDLEYAAKDGNTVFIESEHEGMLDAYGTLVRNIEEILCRIS